MTFGLLRVSVVNVYQFVAVLFPLLVLRVVCGFDCISSGSLSFVFL